MIRSIPDIQVTDQATRDALEAMKEIIEVMLGRRGSDPNDHVLTRGDSSTIIKLFEALNTGLSHDTLADVSADDHHSESHTVASHTDTTATGAELEELTDGSDTTLHDHAGISENTAARHTQGTDAALGAVGTKDPPIDADKALYRDSTGSDALVTSTWTQIKAFLKTYFDTLYPAIAHAIASHSDTTATGAELETLTDNSIANTLHRHSELVASDGSPDPALSSDNDGNLTAVGQISITGASRIRAHKPNLQSMPTSAWTLVEYNVEVWDNLGEYDHTVNYRFTAIAAGYYFVTASLISALAAWGVGKLWNIAIFKNGTSITLGFRMPTEAAQSNYKLSKINDIVYLAATDYVDIRCYHDQGAALNCHSNSKYNYFAVHRLS